MKKIRCYNCHKIWSYNNSIGRSEKCLRCLCDSRVCLNCQFYDRSAYHECKEEQADWTKHKDQGNFCDYFTPSYKLIVGNNNDTEKIKKKLDALFSNSVDNTKNETINSISKLNKLFEKQ